MEKITHPGTPGSVFSGVLDKNLRKLEGRLGVSLGVRGDQIIIDGDQKRVAVARHYFEKVCELAGTGSHLKEEDRLIALDRLEAGTASALEGYAPSEPLTLSRKSVTPKCLNQKAYSQANKN